MNANFPLYKHLPLPTRVVLLRPSGKLSYQRQFVEVRYLIGMECMPHNISDGKTTLFSVKQDFYLTEIIVFLLTERLMKVKSERKWTDGKFDTQTQQPFSQQQASHSVVYFCCSKFNIYNIKNRFVCI